MIAAALLALQLAVAGPAPDALSVRVGGRVADIPVGAPQGVPVVRADVLALALGAGLEREDDHRFHLAIGDVVLGFTDRVAFVRRGQEAIPLASAPYVAGDRLFLPVQVVSDVMPRLVPGLTFDAERGELRRIARRPGGGGAAPGAVARRVAASRPAPRAAPVERAAVKPPAAASAPAPRPAARERRTVVVDAGHGGPDRGMTGPIGASRPRLIEKDVTLAVAKRVAAELERRGMRVIMTRTTDTLIALADRGHIANEADGDVFLSIHVNAANPRWKNAAAARGYETYFLAEAKTEDARRVAELENASERFEAVADTRKGDPLRFILNDMQQNEHLRESSELAAIVQRHLGEVAHGPSRGVKQAGFKVLVTAFMPAVLVEIGFGTNPSEARVLTDREEQQRIAEAIAGATEEYLRRLEPRDGTAQR